MPDTLQRQLSSGDHRLRWGLYVLAGAVAIAVIALAMRLVAPPKSVGHLTVRNDTAYELTIAASGTPGGAVTPVGIVPRAASETFSDVIDEGATWYFHVTCSGVDAGTLSRTRAELESAAWQIELGANADGRCRKAGLAPGQ